jgi:hypothetical protein
MDITGRNERERNDKLIDAHDGGLVSEGNSMHGLGQVAVDAKSS